MNNSVGEQGSQDPIEVKVDEIIRSNREVKRQLNRKTAWFVVATIIFGFLLFRIQAIGNNLIDCTTPGKYNKVVNGQIITGNKCWDRLHDSSKGGTNTAIAIIVDDLYCDHRRAQAKLPPVPDPRILCRDQTPPEIYPGVPH